MTDAVRIAGLEKSYTGTPVLRGVDLSIRDGEIFGLLGANGAGKTTTLECIEGLRLPDAGDIKVNGRIGVQLQSAALPGFMTAAEALELFARWNRTRPDPEVLTRLGIRDLSRKQYRTLSTGQKRRLHLALALLPNPDVLFLDEPTAGLDVEGRAALHDEVRRQRELGRTIVLTTHDMAEVEGLCDRIAILRDGQIAFLGTPAELTSGKDGQRCIVVRTKVGEDRFASEDLAATLLQVMEAYTKDGTAVLDVYVEHGTMDEHFLRVAKGEEA